MEDWNAIQTAPEDATPILLKLSKPLDSNDLLGWVPWDKLDCVIGWRERDDTWEICFMYDGVADSFGYTTQFYHSVTPKNIVGWRHLPK